jgi:hypothetical protein
MDSLALILVEQESVEFYTVAATGETGISITGLAILCGVTQQAISKLVKGVTTNKPTKRLERFVGENLDLTTNTGQKGKIRALRADFCVEVIKYYAYSGNETAQFTLDKFAIIGFNSWVQSITGWQNATSRSPQPQPSTTASPAAAALPPAPGWTQEDWDKLPLADQYHFSETPEQSALRRAADWNDIFRYLAMKNW